jgi:geranylgeranyl diphosphate synthase type I
VRPEEYLTMIAGKTAALVDFSLWTGALLGGADDDTLWALSEFGVGLGKAFQIQDDIAGIWAPQHQTGKQQANDLQNRKKTLPVLIALSESRGADHDLLEAFLSGVTDDLAGALEVLDRCGARSQAEDHLRIHLSAALAALRRAHLTPAGRRELEALAEELTSHRLASS